jgi:hypothetical protein
MDVNVIELVGDEIEASKYMESPWGAVTYRARARVIGGRVSFADSEWKR